jgi:hypothetical protein
VDLHYYRGRREATVRGLEQDNLTEPFAARAKAIAEGEGMDGLDESIYQDLARRHACNLRAMLQEIETGQIDFEPQAAAELEPEMEVTWKRPRLEAPAVKGDRHCPQCAKPIRHGRKYCSVQCYFAWLRANKRRR